MADDNESLSAVNVEFEAQLQDAVRVLRHRGQTSLADLALILPRLRLHAAMWFLGDGVRRTLEVEGDPALFDEFRHCIRGFILSFQQIGYLDHVISKYLPISVLQAARQHAARLVLAAADDDEPYRNGGFGAVPASAAAVRSLERQTFFHTAGAGGNNDVDDGGGVTECGICLKKFVDGGQVSLMPCPSSQGHKFHPDCIAEWLGISNMCPLCRHQLPAAAC